MSLLPYSVTVATTSTGEPITTGDAKSHLRVTSTGEDTYINTLIASAREQVENDGRICLIDRTLTEKYKDFPDTDHFELSRQPLRSVTSITYINSTGGTSTFSSTAYDVDTARRPGVVWLGHAQSWPTCRDEHDALTVTYVAGHDTSTGGSGVPQMAKQAGLLLVAHAYEERQPVLIGTISKELENSYWNLIYRLNPWTYP